MKKPRILCCILTVSILAAAAVSPTGDYDSPSPAWREGPVRYLLTRSEGRTYKRLTSDTQRQELVDAFWRRRDPTPETIRNEFREQFEDRVEQTEGLRLYFETNKPMWMTDLGKIFILLGPPISQDRQQVATSIRDTVTWTYDQVPGVRQHHFNIVFVADVSGELRLSETPALDQSTIQGLSPHTPSSLFGPGALGAMRSVTHGGPGNYVDAWRQASATGGQSLLQDPVLKSVGAAYDSSLMGPAVGLATAQAESQAPPSSDQGTVEVQESFDPIPVELRTDYYQASDGTTYAAFTLSPGSDAGEIDAPVPFGAIVSLDDAAVSYPLNREDQFAAAGPEAPGTFQTGLGLDPGRYRVLFGLRDPASGRVGTHRENIRVANLTADPLNLSSLTLARELRPLKPSEMPDASVKSPYVLGSLRVVPRTTASLPSGEELHLYYQVYGAAAGEAGVPWLEITYQFEGDADGDWQALGAPIRYKDVSHPAQAWSVPTRGWPAGTFRLTVTVVDRVTGHVARKRMVFEITPAKG